MTPSPTASSATPNASASSSSPPTPAATSSTPSPFDTPDALGLILRDPSIRKILHSGDNDIRTLDKEWGLRIVNLYDTSIGARFLGLEKLGLGNIAEEIIGLKLAKHKRLQRADWGIRPLSDEALEYAASDVLHLKRLMDELVRRTDALGRSQWVEEECRRIQDIRYSPPDPPEKSFISIKGSSALDGRGLAILRELALFRESAALKIGRPTFRVMPDRALVAIAQDPKVDLRSVSGIGDLRCASLWQVHRQGRGPGQGRADPSNAGTSANPPPQDSPTSRWTT